MRNTLLTNLSLPFRLLTILAVAALVGEIEACDFPPQWFSKPGWHEWKDEYVNLAWRYSVVIPRGLIGLSSQPPNPQHGFSILLGGRKQSYISVAGHANSLEYQLPVDYAIDHLIDLRKGGKLVTMVRLSQMRLGNIPAIRTVVRYNCPGSEESYMNEFVTAISNDQIVYEMDFYSYESRYVSDRNVLEQILSSWKHLGPRRP